jgi:hypothetical protein
MHIDQSKMMFLQHRDPCNKFGVKDSALEYNHGQVHHQHRQQQELGFGPQLADDEKPLLQVYIQ